MNNFQQIQSKLHQFINKYYYNELIKGVIWFLTLGCLYFIFTLFLEYFLWLKPTERTVLFWLFIVVELFLFVKYIAIPISKLLGFKKGISKEKAAVLIGKHFPEVKDKLLNIIQLKYLHEDSELIEASIQQKSNELKFISFKSAVNLTDNKKYIKYAFIPFFIWLLVYITGNITVFDESFTRVVNYKKEYEPPAPFKFVVLNNSFSVLQGESIRLSIEAIGDIVPQDAKIYFSNENYYLESNGLGKFTFEVENIQANTTFYIASNNVVSKNYEISVVPTPVISQLKMILNYPKYTGKQNEVILNSGNALIPQGTNVNWQVETKQADSVAIYFNKEFKEDFKRNTQNYFSYSSKVFSNKNYVITTSNKRLKDHEKLNFNLEVVPDEFPEILVETNIDSISHGPAEFFGELRDDYGVNKLELVYYNVSKKNETQTLNIPIRKDLLTEFFYIFPEGIALEKGVEYEFYFKVFDNDAVNGSKFSKSAKFSYYKKTEEELKEILLKEQKQNFDEIGKSVEKSKENINALKEFKEELQKKSNLNWNDTKLTEEFMKRQKMYDEMFNEKTDQLEENLKEQPVSKSLEEKKEELQKRIEEVKQLANENNLEKELEEVLDKISKEDLVKKLEELAKKSKQKEQSLERILELTKRFYVEQKTNQIADKLKELAKEQEKVLSDEEKNTFENQKEINEKFKGIKEDLKSLEEENKNLKRPMDLPNGEETQKEVDENLKEALENLEKSNKNSAKSKQKSAKRKMKQMAENMSSAMQAMEGEMIDENIEDLRKIVENLIEVSFQQEDLYESFEDMERGDPSFPSKLKKQQLIKDYFEHIDDSLYVLSLRMVKMGASIQKEVGIVHDNIDRSLANFSENLYIEGRSNQRFVISSTNELANLLSNLLESMMNSSPSMGKGKSGSQEFSLPDIIKKQGDLGDKIEEGKKKGEGKSEQSEDGKKSGKGEKGEDQMNGELFEIYKEQVELRKQLEDLLGNSNGVNAGKEKEVLKQMEEIEKELIDKGFSSNLQEKIKQFQYELLKLQEAKLEQGKKDERKSNESFKDFEMRQIDSLKLKNKYFNNKEILKRQSLPLRSIYKEKVQEYFKQ